MSDEQLAGLRAIVQSHPTILWYVADYNVLDEDAICEAVFNYGSWKDVRSLHSVVGTQKAKEIFTRLVQKPRCNLRPIVRNYFQQYYNFHA